MKENLTDREILFALLGSNQSNEDLSKQVEALRLLVLALLMEVETLRATLLEESIAKGENLRNSIYAKNYISTALLTHDSTGPTGGLHKLLHTWLYSEPQSYSSQDLYMREILMLRRLGFSEAEIEGYKKEAEEHEART